MKNNFIFHFTAPSGVSLNNRIEHQNKTNNVYVFHFNNDEIYIKDSLLNIDNFLIFNGLELFIKCKDVSENSAFEKARILAETVLSLISFTTLSYIGPVKFLSVVNDLSNGEYFNIRFNVYSNKDENLNSLTKLNQETFKLVWGAFKKNNNKDRLLRSITWLRKGLNEKNLDQFVAYFIGMEILQAPLNILFGIEKKKYIFKFFHRRQSDDYWTGIKKVFNDNLQCSFFNKIKKRRNDILHGSKKLDNDFISSVKGYIDIVKKALITSQCLLLNLDKEIIEKIVNQKWAKLKPEMWYTLHGKIGKFDFNSLRELVNFYPTADVKINNKIKGISDIGELTITREQKFVFCCPDNIFLTIDTHEVYGEENSGISKVETKLKK